MNEIELLGIMLKSGSMQPADLADALGVSTRTVRTYIQRINIMLSGSASIECRRGEGYTISVSDQEAFAAALQNIREHVTPASNSASRIQYLLGDLCARSGWVKLSDYARVLFVSRATISNELKRVEDELDSYGLSLERRPHRGIRVVGPELRRRLLIANLAMSQIADSGSDAEHRRNLETISQIIEDVVVADGYEINGVLYQNLLIHVSVALSRIKAGCYVPMPIEQLERIKESASFILAGKVAERIDAAFDVELPEEEVAYLAIHLAGKHLLSDDELGVPGDDAGSGVITDKVWDAVSEMLGVVWDVFHFDLRGDLELRMNLARHIVPLSVRMRYGLGMENPLLEDIKIKYALAYSMAVDSAPVLVDTFGGELSEAEIGYIALAYALALERARTVPAKKNVLVVCASGRGSAHLLEYRIRQQFDSYLDRVETCDATRVGSYDFTGIDYVFTTVPLSVQLPVPVCNVPFFFDERDVRAMTAFLTGGEHSAESTSDVLPFFAPELFRAHLNAATRDEVLRVLCDDLRRADLVPAEYEELVMRREDVLGTAFGGGIALPHAIQACGERTVVNVALLDEPVDWGGQPVQVVLLMSFSRDPEPTLQLFYQCVAQLFSRPDAIRTLLATRTFDCLSTLLVEIEQQLTKSE